MSSRNTPFLLLAGLLAEVVGLELSPGGTLHHLSDASALAVYAFAAGRIGGRRAGWGVGLLGAGSWALDFLPTRWAPVDVESLFWGATHFALAVILTRHLFRVRAIDTTEILHAVALYILVAIAFANTYSIVLWNFPNAIAYPSAVPGRAPSLSQVLYYSFVTQLTVGYGDMSPQHGLTRILSILQAFFGVMYLSILIARFVSLHASAQSGNEPGR